MKAHEQNLIEKARLFAKARRQYDVVEAERNAVEFPLEPLTEERRVQVAALRKRFMAAQKELLLRFEAVCDAARAFPVED